MTLVTSLQLKAETTSARESRLLRALGTLQNDGARQYVMYAVVVAGPRSILYYMLYFVRARALRIFLLRIVFIYITRVAVARFEEIGRSSRGERGAH